ncbi:MAG: F0F1 ATP synthase subunit epsilon, partial [Nitrospirota bacterium]
MNGASFKLRIVTPLQISEREITHIRLKDESDFFGIMSGHIDFLTVLDPALCYFIDGEGKETFIAVNGGVVRVREGIVTITASEVFESDEADSLSGLIESSSARRNAAEMNLRKTLKGIERSFLEKSLEMARGRPGG